MGVNDAVFRFKAFAVRQNRCPMKVGTDGVLLGAWVGVEPEDRRILDIGTGTGLLALMLAQRTPARIEAVEIDEQSALEARDNVLASPWSDRIGVVCTDVQTYDPGCRFDLIVSNPPFYVDSLVSPDGGRTRVRHAEALPFEALRDAVLRLLAPDGRFALVLPPPEAARFVALAAGRLFVRRRTEVCPTPGRGVRRWLLELGRTPCTTPETDRLVIARGNASGDYTPEYRALTRDFYLKF